MGRERQITRGQLPKHLRNATSRTLRGMGFRLIENACETAHSVLIRLAQRDNCYLCGLPFYFLDSNDLFAPSDDHVFPRSRGGLTAGNLLIAHRWCNSEKSNREPYACEMLYLQAINLMLSGVARRR